MFSAPKQIANDLVTSVTDPRSLVTGIASPDTGSTTKTYDPFGLVLTSTDARSKVATYT